MTELHAWLLVFFRQLGARHPEIEGLYSAAPYFIELVLYAGLMRLVWVGAREEMRARLQKPEVIALPSVPPQPSTGLQQSDDGQWWAPTYDKRSGQVTGYELADPPRDALPPPVVNMAKPGMFSWTASKEHPQRR